MSGNTAPIALSPAQQRQLQQRYQQNIDRDTQQGVFKTVGWFKFDDLHKFEDIYHMPFNEANFIRMYGPNFVHERYPNGVPDDTMAFMTKIREKQEHETRKRIIENDRRAGFLIASDKQLLTTPSFNTIQRIQNAVDGPAWTFDNKRYTQVTHGRPLNLEEVQRRYMKQNDSHFSVYQGDDPSQIKLSSMWADIDQ